MYLGLLSCFFYIPQTFPALFVIVWKHCLICDNIFTKNKGQKTSPIKAEKAAGPMENS